MAEGGARGAAGRGADRPLGEIRAETGVTWVIDLDGVVWLSGEPIGDPGASIRALRDRGVRVLFATNNSAPTVRELLGRLRRAGIEASGEELVTSARAAAGMLAEGSTAMVLAGDGVLEALAERGVVVCREGPVDAVVVGWTHEFDFDRLTAVAREIRAGARLVGTNEDPTHPTPEGLQPGSGALLAAVATAGGRQPEVAGKPHAPMVSLVAGAAQGHLVVVGDQPATDGRLAERLGAAFALVDTGVTPPGRRVDDVPVACRERDLATLVAAALHEG